MMASSANRKSSGEQVHSSTQASSNLPLPCPFALKSPKFAMMIGGAINLLIAVVAYCAYQQYYRGEPTELIYTKLGRVEGTLGWSRDGKPFSQYKGIPYAQAPVGDRRFEPPEPALPWEGILQAKSFKPLCLQVEHFATGFIFGKEDCLYLNVYVSQVGRASDKPVMVYIHGGIFHVGGSNFAGPKYFMDENIILVTINYRLGVFGFLNTGDDVISGNMGLKDQNLALRWIQQNIQYFGGDPTRVTIFGESAGAASVHHHVISPASKGLFYKAIHQSGSSINYWAVYRNVKEQAKRFAGMFGCPLSSSVEIAQCLKRLDGNQIVSAHRELMDFYRPQISTFVPTIEVPHAKFPFLTEEPRKLLEEGQFSRIPLMTGVNSNEGQLISKTIIGSQSKLDEANSHWEQWAPGTLHYPEELRNVSEKLRNFYFGPGKDINQNSYHQSYTDMFGDRLFIVRGAVAARIESQFTPTYLYYYDYSGSYNTGELLASAQGAYLPHWLNIGLYLMKNSVLEFLNAVPKGSSGNACHSDEIAMLFNREFVHTISPTHPDYQMSRDLIKLWVSFASNDPILRFRNVEWAPIPMSRKGDAGEDPVKYLRISDDPAVIAEPFQKRRIFWESLNLPNL